LFDPEADKAHDLAREGIQGNSDSPALN